MAKQFQIEALDALIKSGRSDLAQIEIQKIDSASLNRGDLLPLAKICRRAGLFFEGLKALSPVIRPEKSNFKMNPNAEEIAEYALLLSKIGSHAEAVALLSQIPTKSSADVELSSAFVWIAQWNY